MKIAFPKSAITPVKTTGFIVTKSQSYQFYAKARGLDSEPKSSLS